MEESSTEAEDDCRRVDINFVASVDAAPMAARDDRLCVSDGLFEALEAGVPSDHTEGVVLSSSSPSFPPAGRPVGAVSSGS